ncbi:hypothetical protein [Litorivivens sp.]|uniref:hypothetical protein n=1 Tax=Litorivivens sp. TaxID=2020868 RepID=UPI00356A4EF9
MQQVLDFQAAFQKRHTERVPKDTQTRVKIERYSGGCSLRINVKSIPGVIFNANHVTATKQFTPRRLNMPHVKTYRELISTLNTT